MGETNSPITCPACGMTNPSRGHYMRHMNHRELLQVGQWSGNKYVLVWMTPQQAEEAKKAKVA